MPVARARLCLASAVDYLTILHVGEKARNREGFYVFILGLVSVFFSLVYSFYFIYFFLGVRLNILTSYGDYPITTLVNEVCNPESQSISRLEIGIT